MTPLAKKVIAALVVGAAGVGAYALLAPGTSADVTVYKSPTCGCCGSWIDHMRASGFSVAVRDMDNLDAVKSRLGIPRALESCHTALVGGFAIEGHVPAADIRRLLAEKPAARGLAVAGMPGGSPGMEASAGREPYQVVLFGEAGKRIVFARH